MQDGQRTPDGARVTFRGGAVPQEFGRVVRAEAEKLRKEFEDLLLGWVAARQIPASFGRCLGI